MGLRPERAWFVFGLFIVRLSHYSTEELKLTRMLHLYGEFLLLISEKTHPDSDITNSDGNRIYTVKMNSFSCFVVEILFILYKSFKLKPC